MSCPPQFAINIRPLETLEEFRDVMTLQSTIWGYTDQDVDYPAILTVASRFTGQVLGAFDQARLIGFSYALAAIETGRLHSHRVGVHPEYQNQGVGRMLKLAQREDALKKGFDAIQWTFDPMQPRNAYFNIARLGGISRSYIPNLYGITTSPLHGGLPTDRLLIEWNLRTDRVLGILNGRPICLSNDIREISLSISRTASQRFENQASLRKSFADCFRDGYAVCGFVSESNGYKYILEKQ